MKTTCRKSIVISIILLLIGVSVSSAISANTKSIIHINQNEECRECNKVSDTDLILVERLLDRVEVYSKLLKVLSKHNTELREISGELSYEILNLKEELTNDRFPIICETLLIIWYSIGVIGEIIAYFSYDLAMILFAPILFMIYSTAEILDCDWIINI